MKASDFFTTQQKKMIENAIQLAEKETSGEIRVHIELKCKELDVKDRAANIFAQLNMHKTNLRNGVLIYMALTDKKIAILGDVGINSRVPQNFWNDVKDSMQQYFQQNNYTEGLVHAIQMIGEKLKSYFPYNSNDINELPNEVSFN